MNDNTKKSVCCITFSHLAPQAENYLAKTYPGARLQVLDIRSLVLSPARLLKLPFTRYTAAVGFVPCIDSGNGLDLIGAVVFTCRAPLKTIVDEAGKSVRITPSAGVKHILQCVADLAAAPFALLLFFMRAGNLNSKPNKIRVKDIPEKSSFLYFRTDTFEDLRAGGSVGHTTGVIKGFMAYGLRPLYISPYPISAVREMQIPLFTVKRPAWFRNLPELPMMRYSEYLYAEAKNVVSHQKAAFVYQRYSLNNYTGLLLADRFNLPFILEYNGSEIWVARNWSTPLRFEKIAERIESANLRRADLIVVVSRPIRDELVQRGIDPSRILVNPNGVDTEKYGPEVDGSAVRARYGLEGKTVIGFIGTFGRWHGAEVLAEAFGRLVRSFPEYREKVRLFMIGDGLTMPQVKENLAKYDVMDICVLTGRIPQEQGPGHLAACDILASPHVPNPDGTPFFGSPTKLFEYMAMGKGIVASDLDQIGEILEHDKSAWMVKPGDAEPLMIGLKALIDDKQLRARLGQAARREVAKYTWKEHTRKIIDKLREVVQTK